MKRSIRFALAIALVLTTTSAIGQSPAIDQTTRLAALGRTWGLLKYFHPDVAQGTVDWDAALLDEIARVQAIRGIQNGTDEVLERALQLIRER